MIKLSLIASALALASVGAQAETLYALTTDNQLITLDSAAPTMGSAVSITGLGASERLLGLDLRPSNGLLYSISSAGKLYTLGTDGQASFVATLSTPITGSVGFDFNPVADVNGAVSLRVLTTGGSNYAVNANNGTVTTQTAVTAAGSTAKLALTGAAYADNDADLATTAVKLYAIDTASNGLYFTGGPGGGVYSRVRDLGASSLNVFGFDISRSGAAFAGFTSADGYSGLYALGLAADGQTTFIGDFGINGNTAIAPIVGLTAAVPEPTSVALMLAGLGLMGLVMRRRQA
ncbi:putative secreted protein with PEP-CTERM sorting signal [Aquabacterium commune]|uniref:Putative secreted protein with PEP-CTERM sorting signal n=1 Tax=Aquabacterium commune TaxID=70586 RepID=A0A4R6RQ85_9BURK|nr:DUF4394 domain-containing protein [Aquabacterium commune]TDP88317.1 putative secreted protein with PEP-CTERM sorting signal [Aquabacterium commune]